MNDLRDTVNRLRNPVTMPGVRTLKADQLAVEYEELARALAALLAFEQELARQVPDREVLMRSCHLEDIAELLMEES
jgi:hypothetical protein